MVVHLIIKKIRENITKDIKNYLAATLKKDPADVACKGCRKQDGCIIYDSPCATLQCIKEKEIDFCYECEEFPCKRFIPCLDQTEKYRHNIKMFNLCRIAKVGLEEWSGESKNIRNKYFKGKFVVVKAL